MYIFLLSIINRIRGSNLYTQLKNIRCLFLLRKLSSDMCSMTKKNLYHQAKYSKMHFNQSLHRELLNKSFTFCVSLCGRVRQVLCDSTHSVFEPGQFNGIGDLHLRSVLQRMCTRRQVKAEKGFLSLKVFVPGVCVLTILVLALGTSNMDAPTNSSCPDGNLELISGRICFSSVHQCRDQAVVKKKKKNNKKTRHRRSHVLFLPV